MYTIVCTVTCIANIIITCKLVCKVQRMCKQLLSVAVFYALVVEYKQISELTIVVYVKYFIIDIISSEIWSKHVT